MQFHSLHALEDVPRKNISHRLWYPAQPYLSSSFRRSLAVILPLVVLWCTSVHALRYYPNRSDIDHTCYGFGVPKALPSPNRPKRVRYLSPRAVSLRRAVRRSWVPSFVFPFINGSSFQNWMLASSRRETSYSSVSTTTSTQMGDNTTKQSEKFMEKIDKKVEPSTKFRAPWD